MALDIQDLNPVFAQKIKAMLDAAKAQGINPGTIGSGYRSIEQQKELYQNHLAKMAGQSLPYPGVEAPGVVAPPGGSMHNFGLAADIYSPDIQKLRAFASANPNYGIYPLPGDTPHFQLAGDQRALMAHPPTLPAGTDFNSEATLLPYTQPNAVLAANLSPPSSHGITLNTPSPAPAPSAPAPSAPAPSAPAPTVAQLIQKGDYGGAFQALAAKKTDPKTGEEQPGTSTIDKLGEMFQPKQQPQAAPFAPMLQSQDMSPSLAPAAQQLLSQVFAASAKPLSWSSTPYGYGQAGPQVPGTTLNSGGPYG